MNLKAACLFSFIIYHFKAEAVRFERTGAEALRLSGPLHCHLCDASESKDEG